MKTAEARKKILLAIDSGMGKHLLGYEIDNILESFAKERAVEFAFGKITDPLGDTVPKGIIIRAYDNEFTKQ